MSNIRNSNSPPLLNGKKCSENSDCLSYNCDNKYTGKCQLNAANVNIVNNSEGKTVSQTITACPENMLLLNQTEGCIAKSVVLFSNISDNDLNNKNIINFISYFTQNPTYEYVLPVGANCAGLPSNVSCGYNSICENNVCTSNISSSQQPPKYPPLPNYGIGKYKVCNGSWEYPYSLMIDPNGYYWGYGTGCPCSDSFMCGYYHECDKNNKCVPFS